MLKLQIVLKENRKKNKNRKKQEESKIIIIIEEEKHFYSCRFEHMKKDEPEHFWHFAFSIGM